MLAKILIVYIDPHRQYCWGGFGDAFRREGYEITETSYFLTDYSSENNSETLVDLLKKDKFDLVKIAVNLLKGKPKNEFDLVVVFDEYEEILKSIRDLIPTKIPVIYVDFYRETEPVEGFAWISGCDSLPTILNEIKEQLKK